MSRPPVRPHVPHEDPEAPGCCVHCRLPVEARNERHVADPADIPLLDPDQTAAEHRRIGERTREEAF